MGVAGRKREGAHLKGCCGLDVEYPPQAHVSTLCPQLVALFWETVEPSTSSTRWKKGVVLRFMIQLYFLSCLPGHSDINISQQPPSQSCYHVSLPGWTTPPSLNPSQGFPSAASCQCLAIAIR